MPLDANGTASKPSGTTFFPGTTAESGKVNSVIDDLYSILNIARPIAYGGTGATSASAARTALGLAIGSDVMAYSADISALATAWTPASASAAASLAFAEDTDNGAHTVTVTAPAAVAADAVVTLPGVTTTLVGTDTTDTLTNKTLILKQGAAPAPTAEGDIQWDTDDNVLVIGDGAATKTFLPIPASTAAGDIEYYTSAKVKGRIPPGASGNVLTSNGSIWTSAAPPSSGQPVPTSSTFPVGALALCSYESIADLADGATTAGSNLRLAAAKGSFVGGVGAVQAGTWKNVSGGTLATDLSTNAGYFVRTA